MKVIDQIGHEFNLTQTPKRIISLVPSQTELLFDLGLRDEVIGITKFCIHPEVWFKSKDRIGGTKNLKLDKIRTLQPDLIIANKEENTQSEVEQLQKEFNVYTSDISNLGESLEMINDVGRIVNRKADAERLIAKIKGDFKKLASQQKLNKSVLYIIWNNPVMSIGNETFIADMLKRVGLTNVIVNEDRYPELENAAIKELAPDLIFLSSEPFPFKEKHIEAFNNICPGSTVLLVDGEMFSWYGSRLAKAVNYFIDLKGKLG